MPRSHTILRTTGKRKRAASRKYGKPTKRAYKKRVSYRKKAKRGPRNTVALLRNPDLKPNKRTVRVVFMKTIQICNRRGTPTPAAMQRFPSAQFISVNLNSPWVLASDTFAARGIGGIDGTSTGNKWFVSGEPMSTHTDGESVRQGSSYNWLFGQGGAQTQVPPSFNAQMAGIQPGENYGQLFVKKTKVRINYTPHPNVTNGEGEQPTTLFGVVTTDFGGRFFVRKWNKLTGEWNRQLNDTSICQPDLASTPNKKTAAVTGNALRVANGTGTAITSSKISNSRAHGASLEFDYTPGKFNMGQAKDQSQLRCQIIPTTASSNTQFDTPNGADPGEKDFLTFGICPTYAQSDRAAGDAGTTPPVEPIFEGNLVSGYLQLRMEAEICLAEPFSIGATQIV